jgi:aminopeptidase N
LVCLIVVPLMAAPLRRPYTVENYDVGIQADLAGRRLSGEATIRFHSLSDTPISALELDVGGLRIASVAEGQAAQYFERNGRMLAVVLTNPLRPDEHRSIAVRYEAGPAEGLKFFSDQVYATVASDWMPCNDRPGERATLHLTLSAPAGDKAAASGQLTGTRASGGQSVTEWQLDAGAAPAQFGFVVGGFAENASEAEGVKLRALGAGAQVFETTAGALRFLSGRTGKAYPGASYTQVFVHGDTIASMAGGLTLLPESYAQSTAKPDAPWLETSELARQWYGVGVALKDWSDAWLSEGVSAFVADEFVAERLGKETLQQEIEHSRQIYNRLRTEGKDRPLSFIEWTTRQDAGGDVPIHKGVCFLFLVHELVGDNAFWEGLRTYTGEQWRQEASSDDFQKVFEGAKAKTETGSGGKGGKAAKKNRSSPIDTLFDTWVWGIARGNGK